MKHTRVTLGAASLSSSRDDGDEGLAKLYSMSTQDKEALAAIIKKAVLEALSTGNPFPLYTVGEVAIIFHVSKNTVLTWRKNGLLKAHAHLISGCSWRWLFTH